MYFNVNAILLVEKTSFDTSETDYLVTFYVGQMIISLWTEHFIHVHVEWNTAMSLVGH